MKYFLVNILLALLWASLQQFRPLDLVGGFIIGYFLIWLTRKWIGDEAAQYARRIPMFIAFVLYYLKELVVSTWSVALAVFRDQSTLKPGIIALPLAAQTDLEIVLLNNLLIFTPGTLGVDLSPDRRTLFVHIFHVPDADLARAQIKTGLERRLLEVLR